MIRIYLRRFLWLAFAGVLVAALVYSFWPKPIEVEAVSIVEGPLSVTVNEDGRTRIRERYVVSSPLAGQLIRVELRPGDSVVRGETLLAAIRPQSPQMLDARQLTQAQARVQASQAAVQRSRKSLNAANVAREFAESELRRARTVARGQIISRSELETSEMRFRMRNEEFEAAKFAEDISRFELDQAQAALQFTEMSGDKSLDARDLEIRAPIDGCVLRVLQESATVVAPGSTLIELGAPHDLEVEVDVLSTDAVRILPGAQVLFEHWGGEHPLQGCVRLVEPSGFTKISALGVEEQRVNVIVDLLSPREERPELGDGFRVEARIVVWESKRVVKAPLSALFRRGDTWAVFVLKNQTAILRTVKAGHRSGLEVEVLEGLQPGEQVIPHPSDKLQDGSHVRERPTDAGPN